MHSYRFGEFELDLDAQQLRLRGEARCTSSAGRSTCWCCWSTAEGRVVPREDIIAKLWPPNVIIDFDSGINTLVRKVRSALGDSPEEPTFIETVAGRGYRFIAPVIGRAPVSAAAPARRRCPPCSSLPSATLGRHRGGTGLVARGSRSRNTPASRCCRSRTSPGARNWSYMAAGIAEETSIALANIDLPDLSVIGVVSARALAGSDVSLAAVWS